MGPWLFPYVADSKYSLTTCQLLSSTHKPSSLLSGVSYSKAPSCTDPCEDCGMLLFPQCYNYMWTWSWGFRLFFHFRGAICRWWLPSDFLSVTFGMCFFFLLRCNSHNMKLIDLKWKIRWLLYIPNVQPPPLSRSETFSSPQVETPYPWSPPPAPGNCQSAFCLYGFIYLGYFIYIESYNMWPFVSGLVYTFWHRLNLVLELAVFNVALVVINFRIKTPLFSLSIYWAQCISPRWYHSWPSAQLGKTRPNWADEPTPNPPSILVLPQTGFQLGRALEMCLRAQVSHSVGPSIKVYLVHGWYGTEHPGQCVL